MSFPGGSREKKCFFKVTRDPETKRQGLPLKIGANWPQKEMKPIFQPSIFNETNSKNSENRPKRPIRKFIVQPLEFSGANLLASFQGGF